MIHKKRRLFRIIESHINEINGEYVDNFFGPGTKIKIHTISQSIKKNSHLILVEVVVYLGEKFEEETLNESVVDFLIKDAMKIIDVNFKVVTLVRWDV